MLALAAGLIVPSYITLPFESPRITVNRGVLLVFVIPSLIILLKRLGMQQRQIRTSDLFIVLTSLWVFLAYSATEGVGVAAVSGSLVVLEAAGGYFIARAYFSTREAIESFFRAIRWVMVVIIGCAVIDHLMGYDFVGEKSAALVGGAAQESIYRNGVLRARSTMDHPILYGTLCAFAFAIFFYEIRKLTVRVCFLALCAFGCVLAMSSAPLLALFAAIALIAYDRILRSYPWRWHLLLLAGASFVVLLLVARDDPIGTLIRYFTIDQQTGFYRLLIWQYAGAEALNSPLVGIGQQDWKRIPGMTGSIDAIWLALAVQFGIPAAVFYGLTLLTSMRRSRPDVPDDLMDPYLAKVRQGLSIVISLTIFVGFTVHFWGPMLTFLGMLAGLRSNLEEIRRQQGLALLDRRRGGGAEPQSRALPSRMPAASSASTKYRHRGVSETMGRTS